MKHLLPLFPILLLIFVVGCFENNSPTQPNNTPPTPVQLAEVSGPNSSNAPSEITTQISAMNAASGYWRNMFSWTSAANSAQVGDTFTWTRTFNQLTITATAIYIDNNTVKWTVILNGSQAKLTFDNWIAITGTASVDGQSGNFQFYKINSTEIQYKYSWSTDSEGNWTVIFEDLTESEKIVIVNNSDGSGTFGKYENGVIEFEATWDADGTGSWIKFNDDGSEKKSGSWARRAAPTIPHAPHLQFANSTYVPEWIKGRITAMNSFFATENNWFSMASHISPTLKDTTFVWSYTYDQLTVTLEAKYDMDGSVEWTVTLNGTDGKNTYNNWTAIKGTTSADGNSGSFEIFKKNSTDIEYRYSWSIDSSGNKTVIFEDLEDGDKYVAVNNVDGSGSLTEYENGVKSFEVLWNADGSGSWAEYDANGNVVDSGSWT